MSGPAIDFKQVSKSYIIGHKDLIGTYKLLSESIKGTLIHPLRTARGLRSDKEVFWAVKDVSFSVNEGEVIGLIGRNGAGKSTILKIISQITYPTKGEILLKGRVGSLLEVGTGFHPELSGRENIYLNGAILGMKRTEIDRNFDAIVKFAELERFLDTPVKRYSSGMYVRLGFAVAAHLDPEILLVDEVLAVGDAAFQKKCLGKIKDVGQSGRTILFVSHNMPTVEGLCEKALLIEEGRLVMTGDSHDVIAEYMRMLSLFRGNDLSDPSLSRRGNGQARFTWIEILDEDDDPMDSIPEGVPFKVSMTIRSESTLDLESIRLTFTDLSGRPVMSTWHSDSLSLTKIDRGEYRFAVYMNPNPLLSGSFNIKLSCSGPRHDQEYDVIDYAYNLNIAPTLSDVSKRPGIVKMDFEWEAKKLS